LLQLCFGVKKGVSVALIYTIKKGTHPTCFLFKL